MGMNRTKVSCCLTWLSSIHETQKSGVQIKTKSLCWNLKKKENILLTVLNLFAFTMTIFFFTIKFKIIK